MEDINPDALTVCVVAVLFMTILAYALISVSGIIH